MCISKTEVFFFNFTQKIIRSHNSLINTIITNPKQPNQKAQAHINTFNKNIYHEDMHLSFHSLKPFDLNEQSPLMSLFFSFGKYENLILNKMPIPHQIIAFNTMNYNHNQQTTSIDKIAYLTPYIGLLRLLCHFVKKSLFD